MNHAEEFRHLGRTYFPAAIGASGLQQLFEAIEPYDAGRSGNRIADAPAIAAMIATDSAVSSVLNELTLASFKPVRAILFDKSPSANWALGWHQDRTICVRDRRPVDGFEVWTVKDGLIHVEPPFEIIERMITLRIHLDDVDEYNAPLLVADGSHRFGRVAVNEIERVAAGYPSTACLAQAGDIWAYSTPIVHASKRTTSSRRRRVLQVDYSADELPGGLEWRGI